VPVPPDVGDLATVVGPVFAADERIRFAYVFGSVADGTATAHSDIDLGVSVQPRGTLLDDARLHDALVAALGRDDVDLVVLEDAPLWLRYRVVGGRPVFSRDDVARVRHRAATELAYLDFKPYRDVLGKHGVLDPELTAALRPMARMRNLLVHYYADVSAERVHEIIRTRLGDFDRFAEQITSYADRS